MNFTVSFELSQKVSSSLSLLLILLLSVMVAIFSLHAARDIIIELGNTDPAFHLENRPHAVEAINAASDSAGDDSVKASVSK